MHELLLSAMAVEGELKTAGNSVSRTSENKYVVCSIAIFPLVFVPTPGATNKESYPGANVFH